MSAREELGSAVYDSLEQNGQLHLLRFWGQLSDPEKAAFRSQLASINWSECCEFFQKCTTFSPVHKIAGRALHPVAKERTGSAEDGKNYWDLGLEAVARGEVGVILLAGGQGTRLGVDYPKGMFKVGLPSGKSLFQLQAERILRLQQLAREKNPELPCKIQWYIMTSEATDAQTEEFFKGGERPYFGLEENQCHFFEQGLLPCFDVAGKAILNGKGDVALAPDGNGGLYRAVASEGLLGRMRAAGLRYLHVYCVDNSLVRVADPDFLGFCISKGADCAAKVVERTDPGEPVGVVCVVEGLAGPAQVVEYSEISKELSEKLDPADKSRLYLHAGNICNHFYTLDFLNRVSTEDEGLLMHHVAHKKIPFVDESGACVKPEKPNGIKMEKFVFDVFPFAKNFVLFVSAREREFSPLKNADAAGKDCAATSRRDIFRLHREWLERAGASLLSAGKEEEEPAEVEISPLVSYGGENLEGLVKGRSFQCPLHIDVPWAREQLKNGEGENGV